MVAINGNGNKSRLVDQQGRPLVLSPTKGYKAISSGIVFGGIGWTGLGLEFLGGGPLADLPRFTRAMIESMRRESLCKFAVGMVKSPYSSACTLNDPQDRDSGYKGFFVDCPNPAIKRTVEDALSRIWLTGSAAILEAMDYGQIGIEVEFAARRGGIMVETVKGFDPADVTALRNQTTGRVAGCRARRIPGKNYVDLVDGRGVWIVHEPLFGSHIGIPMHLGAYPPWWEKWHHRGAVFSRRLWNLNCAFRGRVVRYPLVVFGQEHGFDVPKSGRDIAEQILDTCSNGGALAIPNLYDDNGNPLWSTEDPKAQEGGKEVNNYPKDLDTEQLRGYTIPDNIITATLQDSTGTYGGRAISFEAFLAMRQQFWVSILSEVDRQCIRYLARWNHGPHVDYEIRATELLPRQEPNKNAEQPGGKPGLPGMGDASQAKPPGFGPMSFGGFLDRHLDEYIERAVGRGTLRSSAVVDGQEAARLAFQQGRLDFESKHPRGQPNNAGQFAKKEGTGGGKEFPTIDKSQPADDERSWGRLIWSTVKDFRNLTPEENKFVDEVKSHLGEDNFAKAMDWVRRAEDREKSLAGEQEQPEPKPETKPERNPLISPRTDEEIAQVRQIADQTKEYFAKHVVDLSYTEKQQARYVQAINRVIDYMTVPMMQAATAKVGSVTLYESLKDVTEQARTDGVRLRKGAIVAGMFSRVVGARVGTLVLDGDGYDATAEEIYAHEMGHAIDFADRHSNTYEWNSAWRNEILKPKNLSQYATTNPSEGLAEYFRLMNQQPRQARTDFPECWACFKKWGYVEDPQTSQMAFDESLHPRGQPDNAGQFTEKSAQEAHEKHRKNAARSEINQGVWDEIRKNATHVSKIDSRELLTTMPKPGDPDKVRIVRWDNAGIRGHVDVPEDELDDYLQRHAYQRGHKIVKVEGGIGGTFPTKSYAGAGFVPDATGVKGVRSFVGPADSLDWMTNRLASGGYKTSIHDVPEDVPEKHESKLIRPDQMAFDESQHPRGQPGNAGQFTKKETLDPSRTLGVDSVVDGDRKAGFSDNPTEIQKAREAGLATIKAGQWTVYAKTAEEGRELADHLRQHGYGNTLDEMIELSRKAGYNENQVDWFREFLKKKKRDAGAG